MSYATPETSRDAGQPVELYKFRRGIDEWTYTSADAAIVYAGATYAPAVMRRSAPEATSGAQRSGATLTIEVPRDFAIATLFRGLAPPPGTVTLTIFRRHRTDAEVIPYWVGRVRGASWAGSRATLECEGLDAMLKRPALRRGVGINCEHMLFDAACGLVATAWRATGTLATVTGTTLQAAVFATQANGWWVSGFVRVDNQDYRMVTAHSGDTVTVLSPFEGLAAGDAIEVFAGCDRTYATCGAKFSNQARFGGWPFWPTSNPYQTGLA